jgi:hypothetical protein
MINSKLPFLLESELDSNEELYFAWWLSELCDNGYVLDVIPQPQPFSLQEGLCHTYVKEMKTKNKILEEVIIKPSVYTTDFLVKWSEKALNTFVTTLDTDDKIMKGHSHTLLIAKQTENGIHTYIEVKPSFDQNNMTRLSRTNIKWVWDKHKEYINLVIPEKHFKKTFTPERFLLTTKSKTKRKLKYIPLTLKEYLK